MSTSVPVLVGIAQLEQRVSDPKTGKEPLALMIDAVRAARNIAETGAGDRWVVVGHSQGGHAAIATNELAPSYGPELQLLGTVASAPGAIFDRTYGPIDEIVGRVVGVMMLYGAAGEHPEIDPDFYAGPQTAAAAAAVAVGVFHQYGGSGRPGPRRASGARRLPAAGR